MIGAFPCWREWTELALPDDAFLRVIELEKLLAGWVVERGMAGGFPGAFADHGEISRRGRIEVQVEIGVAVGEMANVEAVLAAELVGRQVQGMVRFLDESAGGHEG